MSKYLRLLLLALLLSLAACNRNEIGGQGGVSGPVEQKPAPGLTVTALNGTYLNLADLKGKVVMLNFWATWCPPCREEIPAMMKLNSAMAGKPFQMVAVSIDEGGKPAIEAFFRESGYSLPAYLDPDNKGARTYGITGVPETFIIDKNGILVKKVIGPLAWDSPDVTAFLEGLIK